MLVAFFFAVGIGAHALDEFHGHPLQTGLSDRVLVGLAVVSIGIAAIIGIVGAVTLSWWIAVFVVAGVGLVLAYNLELFGGWFHTDLWFAVAWGAFPALVGYVVNAGTIRWPGVVVALGCLALSAAQRALSTPVRRLRRRTSEVAGVQRLRDGTTIELSVAGLAAPMERALTALSCGVVLIAIGAVAARW
jgi:4-hydroxybenzoate polyprenyltransferase